MSSETVKISDNILQVALNNILFSKETIEGIVEDFIKKHGSVLKEKAIEQNSIDLSFIMFMAGHINSIDRKSVFNKTLQKINDVVK